MKKRIISFLLALCTLYILGGSAYATSLPQLPNVTDTAELLNETQAQRLEQMALAVTEQFDVGVYIVTVDDYCDIDPAGVYEATYGIYHEYAMGAGTEHNGIMLMLSMNARDYAIFCYGEKAEYAFNDYGLEQLEKVFLDNFANDDWSGGFEDYIRECANYLEKAEEGKPVSKSPLTMVIIVIIISLLIATIVCAVLVGQMKTVHKKTTADAYSTAGFSLSEQYDQFTHRTETRRKIERSTSSSSASHSEFGGGGSGRSGKF